MVIFHHQRRETHFKCRYRITGVSGGGLQSKTSLLVEEEEEEEDYKGVSFFNTSHQIKPFV